MKNIHYSFSEFETTQLQKHRMQCKDYRIRDRLLSIILIATVFLTIEEVAIVLGKSKITIERWFNQYVNKGIDGILCYDYKPKQSYLNFNQKNQINIFVTFENPETTKEVTNYINEKFGITYSNDGTRKILKELGLKIIRCKTIPGNVPSEEEQKQFINTYIELRAESDSITLFCDGMHLVHQNIPNQCWGDPSFPPIIETNSSRKRINILGVYNPADHTFLHITSEENCNAERVIELLTLVSNTYSGVIKINIIVDNARYFHACIVREWLIENPNINLVFLPAYAPNLNLIERFWKYVKKQLVRNQYYSTYKEFRAKVFQFLNNVKEHTKNLKTLMVEKFQIIKARIMPLQTKVGR